MHASTNCMVARHDNKAYGLKMAAGSLLTRVLNDSKAVVDDVNRSRIGSELASYSLITVCLRKADVHKNQLQASSLSFQTRMQR